MDTAKYSFPDYDGSISISELANADREEQLAVMRTWFFQNYEDPAERTPYESGEGGYIWISGGPYDAREELESEFYSVVPENVIEELATELNSICSDWAPTDQLGHYDEYLVDDIAKITEYYSNFSTSILNIESLLKTTVDGSVENCFCRLLYVNVITSVETYLSDAFISSVMKEKPLMRRFVECTPEFKHKKFSVADVFKVAEKIDHKVKSYLAYVVWHNLRRVKPMYRSVLGVSFPQDIGDLTRAVLKRHDIVHRNGKSKNGEEIVVLREDVTALLKKAKAFVKTIDQELSDTRSNDWVNKDASR